MSRATISRLLRCLPIAMTISTALVGDYRNPMFDVLQRQRSLAHVILVLIACGVAVSAEANKIPARVVWITDGDTITVLAEQRREMRVRLAEIDAPERRQPYGDRARQMLAELVFERRGRLMVTSTDRNSRLITRLFVESRDINAEMVRRGGAWVYWQYSSDTALLHLEADARKARRRLWALHETKRLPTWEWRERRRQSR